MSVEVDGLSKRYGAVTAADQVRFQLEDGMLLALLGPSGSGKTTVLRMLAGLETPDAGLIRLGPRTVFDGQSLVPPEERGIGMVFQDYALWPHMTVAQNIAFGLRLRRLARQETARQVTEALALVHLDGLGARYPDQLSGGQQQRVAIARALALRPPLLLMDEPLSNLDAALREEMRVDLARLLKAQGTTAIYVTHDRVEALAMADWIVVMRDGRVAQQGTPEELYQRPATPFIAGFLGAANFLPGVLCGEEGGTPATLRAGEHTLRLVRLGRVAGRGVAVLRPEDGTLHAEPPRLEGNALPGEVVHSEFLGGRWRHVVDVGAAGSLRVVTAQRAPAQRVWVHFPFDRSLLLADE